MAGAAATLAEAAAIPAEAAATPAGPASTATCSRCGGSGYRARATLQELRPRTDRRRLRATTPRPSMRSTAGDPSSTSHVTDRARRRADRSRRHRPNRRATAPRAEQRSAAVRISGRDRPCWRGWLCRTCRGAYAGDRRGGRRPEYGRIGAASRFAFRGSWATVRTPCGSTAPRSVPSPRKSFDR